MESRMPWPTCVPELTDGVVRLRAHRREDVAPIVEQSNDAESIRWTTIPQPYGPEQAHGFLDLIEAGWNDPDGSRYFAICAADDPQGGYLGTIDLRPKGAGIASVGFGLHPAGRGRGLMARALRLIARHWFDEGGGVRLFWQANAGNFASWRVAWSCGFTFHGVMPEQLPQRGEALDAWTASLGRDDDLTGPAAPWREAVVLEGDGIRLRPWRDDDVEAIELDDTPEHFEPPGARRTPENFAAWLLTRRTRIAQGFATLWCIADAESDRALGSVLLKEKDQEPGCAELGYDLNPSARGRGAATIAGRLAIAHGFASPDTGGLGLRRIGALTVGDNDASAQVLRRLGFTEWGREPAFCEREDGFLDDARHWVLFPHP